MDLSPSFTDHTVFYPGGAGGELKLFILGQVKLVHGWLGDPSSQEFEILKSARDYDSYEHLSLYDASVRSSHMDPTSAINIVVSADELTQGKVVESTDERPSTAESTPPSSTDQDASVKLQQG